jgi:uncharacterized membrane protein YdjX (TVP38/TMEM64 family)
MRRLSTEVFAARKTAFVLLLLSVAAAVDGTLGLLATTAGPATTLAGGAASATTKVSAANKPLDRRAAALLLHTPRRGGAAGPAPDPERTRRLAARRSQRHPPSDAGVLRALLDGSGGDGDDPRGGVDSRASAAHSAGGSSPQTGALAVEVPPAVRKALTRSLVAAASALVIVTAYRNRDFLLNKERIQEETLRLLRGLHRDDADGAAAVRSLALYSVGMALWELCSLSTIPVETAAGMVFGWRAAPFSIAGKLMGAGTAFGLGRGWLHSWATARLSRNSVWQLVATSQRFSPWATAFLMKYSCFPEFIKNFGSSFLQISPLQFATATVIHGGGFTLLWTWWGVDAALRLSSPAGQYVASPGLKVALAVAGFVGVVATPALMAWWINSLRQEAAVASSSSSARSRKQK